MKNFYLDEKKFDSFVVHPVKWDYSLDREKFYQPVCKRVKETLTKMLLNEHILPEINDRLYLHLGEDIECEILGVTAKIDEKTNERGKYCFEVEISVVTLTFL